MSKDQEDFTKVGFVYAAVLLVLSNIIASDWKNDEIFYLLSIYPYWTGLIFWIVIGYLSATLKPSFGGILCLCALITYNYGLIQKIIGGDDGTRMFIDRLWANNKLGGIIFMAFYVGGQLFIVGIIAKRNFFKANAI